MTPNSVQQEILLVINSSLAQRQFCKKNDQDEKNSFSPAEQLEDACWNGQLYDLLPGVIATTENGKRLFVWQMKQENNCLEMELGEFPRQIDYWYSIDPYNSISTKNYN